MQDDELLKPTKILYFIKEKSVIHDNKCGRAHNVALDINGDVYSWGSDEYGQCGDGMDYGIFINKPKLIETVKEFVIDYNDCGYTHTVKH